EETVAELAMAISPELKEVQRLLREQHETDSDEYHDAIAHFIELDGYRLEAKAKRILAGLAFRESDFDRPARTMSGGWIMRAHLARLLVMEPDVLMLDEPTNHLDLESLGWFENYLQNYPGAILVVSHDRAFLNSICRAILEISQQRLHNYTGNYDQFLAQKRAREENYLAAYKNQQREIAHLEVFINRFRAKASKASQAQERIKRLQKMERLEAPQGAEATVKFKFPQPARSGQKVITLEHVQQAYGERVVYHDLNLVVERDQRTVLVGPNGAGKSTLLKIVAGLVPIQAGKRLPGHNTTIGYFAQHRTEILDIQRTVLEEALANTEGVNEQGARTLLGSFLFRKDDVFKRVAILSGGEKSRLALVKILLNPPNLLLLDEPTTHLDIPSIDALIGALQQYRGTLLFISHDVYFIRCIATTVLHIHAGSLTPYPGDYDYFLDKSNATSERSGLIAPLSEAPKTQQSQSFDAKLGLREIREQRKTETQHKQASLRKRREQEKELAKLEAEIVKLESKQKALTAQLADQTIYADSSLPIALNRELATLTSQLALANAAWNKAAEALSKFVDV
ncbi:MAG TPA: ATP-binding cassette domain-containing protein, partial [Terrimicrobiaceae bacterium]